MIFTCSADAAIYGVQPKQDIKSFLHFYMSNLSHPALVGLRVACGETRKPCHKGAETEKVVAA